MKRSLKLIALLVSAFVVSASRGSHHNREHFGTSLVAFRPVSGGHITVGVTAYVGFGLSGSRNAAGDLRSFIESDG